VRLRVLASGSGGNCLAVRSAGGALVFVDCGISYRELCRRAKTCGITPCDAAAILFTHDHKDHVIGLATFHKHSPFTALLANSETADAIAARTGVDDGWIVFDGSTPFDVLDLRVTPFAVSHDAANPVGYLIEDTAEREATLFSPCTDPSSLFVATDTGCVTPAMQSAFARADCAVLESNYDPVLLETSNRTWSLKRRISGDSGHLSNEAAADLVLAANPMRLKTLLLAHISQECNAPDIALGRMRAALTEAGRPDVVLDVLSQGEPSPLFEF
jgi:phosphoribosyl 1,2-cyclic phosphodiesterase